MKSLLFGFLFLTFAQSSFAATTIYNDTAKKVYNALATFGLRLDEPAQMVTAEWAKPVKCLKSVEGGLYYICNVHDQFRNVTVSKTGLAAKKLYELLKMYNGEGCSHDGRCNVYSPDVKCVHKWPNKDNPPEFYYQCIIEKETT